MIAFHAWVKIYLTVIIVVLSTLLAFNYLIDPFGQRDWIVNKQFKPVVHERSEKYNYIFYENGFEKFDCLILGSSRVMTITPADNPQIGSCYNFGVHVANNAEKLFLLQEWLKRKPLQKVFLGIEFYNFHQAYRPLHLNTNNFLKGAAGNYLSFNTLNMSYKSLRNQLSNQPQTFFEDDGSINYYLKDQKIADGTYDQSSKKFTNAAKSMILNNYINTPFIYEKKALAPLQEIKKLCEQHNIELYAFLTPMQEQARLQLQEYPEVLQINQAIRDDLSHLFPKLHDFSLASQQNQDPKNFYDPWHYRKDLGNEMVKMMLK